MINYAKLAVKIAKEQGMYLVLDADALWMVGQDLGLIRGYRRAVLTPNVMEFKRLSESVVCTHYLRSSRTHKLTITAELRRSTPASRLKSAQCTSRAL